MTKKIPDVDWALLHLARVEAERAADEMQKALYRLDKEDDEAKYTAAVLGKLQARLDSVNEAIFTAMNEAGSFGSDKDADATIKLWYTDPKRETNQQKIDHKPH